MMECMHRQTENEHGMYAQTDRQEINGHTNNVHIKVSYKP